MLLLDELGVAPLGRRRFLLDEGRGIEIDFGEAWPVVDGGHVATSVVLGQDDAPFLPVSGILEVLATGVDSVEQRTTSSHLSLY